MLLGGAALEGERGPIGGRSAQRRRIALLSVLAVARRGVSRDKLIGYLWEEADTDRARRLLSESVYVVRKALGEDAILSAGDELRLNEAVVWCDVAEFADAVTGGDLERAAGLYRGPFLDGFFVSEALEFEQWAERERDRLAREYGDVLRRLAERAESTGDLASAAKWWRALCRVEPYAAAPAIGYMRAAEACGDRAAALQHAAAHAARLRAEFDAEPDPAVEAFARELREAPLTMRVTRPEPTDFVSNAQPPGREPDESSGAAVQVAAESAPLIRSPRSRIRIRRRLRVGILLTLTLFVAFFIFVPQRPTAEAPVDAGQLIVFPMNVYGPSQELRNGLALWLNRNLDGAGDVRGVDMNVLLGTLPAGDSVSLQDARSTAERFRARYFILASVVETGAQVRIEAALYDTMDVSRPHIEVAQGMQDSIPRLMDALSARLLVALGATEAEQLRRAAMRTTDSFEALKYYWDGEAHFLAGQYGQAVSAFTRAAARDPTFALAHYRLSVAAEWNFDFLLARRAAAEAIALSGHLSDAEQALLQAWNSFLQGDYQLAEAQYGAVLLNQPDNVEALYGLAEVRAHYNPVRGERARDAEPAFRSVLAQVPAYGEARFHALELAVRDRDLARFDTLMAKLDPRATQHPVWRAVRAHAWGNAAEKAAIAAELDTSADMTIALAAARVAAHTHEFAAAARIARLLTLPHRTREWRAGAHIFLAQLQLAAGDAAGALSELQRADPLERDWTREMEAMLLLHPFADDSYLRGPAMQRLRAWRPDSHTPSRTFFFSAHVGIHPQLRTYLLGLLSVAKGDTAAAREHSRELMRLRGDAPAQQTAGALAASLQGHLLLAHDRRNDALEYLLSEDAQMKSPPEFLALSPFHSRAHDRYTIAEIYRLQGNTEQAVRWYRSLLDGFDFVYAAPAHQRLAAILDREDPDEAAWHARELRRLTRR